MPLDDPFGVGPRFCDENPGVGGDSCVGFASSAGFFTEPEHLTTAHASDDTVSVSILSEYTPTTALKTAAEEGIVLRAFSASGALAAEGSWSVEGSAVVYRLTPAGELEDGWYSLLIPRAVREAHGASYTRFVEPPLFDGGPFVELDDGDLRADFRVGSQPLVARARVRSDGATITFSETLEADQPPVSLAIGSYQPACGPSGWSGAGRKLEMSCSEPLIGYGDPVSVSIAEGFVTAAGEALRGPDGATHFVLEVPEDSSLELGVPAGE